jgi:fructosamine-3-kinase
MPAEEEVFKKINPLSGSDQLLCEQDGLATLGQYQAQHGLGLPLILSASRDTLTFKLIHPVRPRPEDWRRLGAGLARLHQIARPEFGYSQANYIGLNPQRNDPCGNWGEFFFERRLKFQVEIMRPSRERDSYSEILLRQRSSIIAFLNAHKPVASLLHGDLWSGNIIFAMDGPYLIDPAVYFGDREADIAATKMFGGFAEEFYQAYDETWPLLSGTDAVARDFARRSTIYNLYHYLNHMNLFGAGYAGAVRAGFDLVARLHERP